MVRFVVFDVGGVLIDWDPRYLYRKLLPDEAAIDDFFDEVDFAAWNVGQDAGREWDTAVSELSRQFPERRSLIEAAHTRWPEMVAGPVHGTVAILEALRANPAPVYAITNFSSEKWLDAQRLYPFLAHFEDTVVSGVEKIIKPDAKIFQRFLRRNSLRAEECLFIDDSLANVTSAAQLGMATVHFESPEVLREVLVKHRLLT